MKKRELIVLLVIAIVFASAYLLINSFWKSDTGNYLVVVNDGVEIDRKSLSEDGVYDIRLENGYHNKYNISSGVVSMVDANCRDGLCVKMKNISKNGEMIICLPHKLYLKIISDDDSDIDGVSR